jgi:hypothetical protein
MLCPSCRATLFAGAFECRFCGKKLPQPSSARIPGLALIGIFLGICALLAWAALSGGDPQREQIRLRQAAACGATTAQKLEDAAGQMAAKSHISAIDAMHRAEIGACPTMKGD